MRALEASVEGGGKVDADIRLGGAGTVDVAGAEPETDSRERPQEAQPGKSTGLMLNGADELDLSLRI
uniref:Uncharacterized protein n=1 Tax=Arundo donax TaxID=35708 RepID=A0A0A9C6L3_ARUDO